MIYPALPNSEGSAGFFSLPPGEGGRAQPCRMRGGTQNQFGTKRLGNSASVLLAAPHQSRRSAEPASPRGSLYFLARSSQNATALAAATFRESTPWYMGIFTV